MKIALFPGSFNPFTVGHKSVVDRALGLFDRIIIAIGVNENKSDGEPDDLPERIRAIANLYADEPAVEVYSYEGLTVDFAEAMGAGWLLRGVRTVKDFEYESNMADINRRISGIETLLLFTLPEHACISSSMVRELSHFGVDTSQFIPTPSPQDD